MGAQVLEETVTENETKVASPRPPPCSLRSVMVAWSNSFDPINIISAVKSAFGDLNKEVGPEEDAMIRGFANQVEGEIKGRYTGPAKIEDIQNLVEHALIDAHLYDVARAYTNYRLDKDIQRAKATDVNEAVARFINHDPTDCIHENANKDSNVYSTQRDLLAGAVSKAAAFNMLPPAVSERPHEGRHSLPRCRLFAVHCPVQLLLAELLGHVGQWLHSWQRSDLASPKSIAIAATQTYPDHEGRGLQPVWWPDRQPCRRASCPVCQEGLREVPW